MAPKTKPRSSHQPQISQSSLPSPSPQPVPRTNANLNLSVLRRHDPSITSILSIAPYAVIYTFSPSLQIWEKSGIEGSLFVCTLAPLSHPDEARYAVVVLNRHGLQNFHLLLRSADDVQLDDETYIILQGSSEGLEAGEMPVIYGLWVFSEGSGSADTRALHAQLIQECATHAEASRMEYGAEASEHQVQEIGTTGGDVLGSLFDKARQDYHSYGNG